MSHEDDYDLSPDPVPTSRTSGGFHLIALAVALALVAVFRSCGAAVETRAGSVVIDALVNGSPARIEARGGDVAVVGTEMRITGGAGGASSGGSIRLLGVTGEGAVTAAVASVGSK